MLLLRLLRASLPLLGLATATLCADTDYNFTVRVTDADGDFSDKAFTLKVLSAPPLASFDSWAELNISNPAKRGHYDDADGDGIANVIEYAFNLDPNTPEGLDSQPTIQLGSNKISITFYRDGAKSDIIYLVEGSDDLTAWNDVLYNSANPGLGYETNNNGDFMTVEDTKYLDTSTQQRYLRVRVLPAE